MAKDLISVGTKETQTETLGKACLDYGGSSVLGSSLDPDGPSALVTSSVTREYLAPGSSPDPAELATRSDPEGPLTIVTEPDTEGGSSTLGSSPGPDEPSAPGPSPDPGRVPSPVSYPSPSGVPSPSSTPHGVPSPVSCPSPGNLVITTNCFNMASPAKWPRLAINANRSITNKVHLLYYTVADESLPRADAQQDVAIIGQELTEHLSTVERRERASDQQFSLLHTLNRQQQTHTDNLTRRLDATEAQLAFVLDERQIAHNDAATQCDLDVEEVTVEVGELTRDLQTSQRELSTATEKLALREEDTETLQNEMQSRQALLVQLQEEAEWLRAQLKQMELDKDSQLTSLKEELLSQTQQLDSCQARVSYLEVEVETLTEQLHSPEVCEEDQNGSVTVDDLDHVQKVNRELEQQLSDKNRTIKQLQQRLAELKRTLQKELKLKPEPEAEGREKLLESRAEKQEKVCPDPPPASTPSPPTSNTTVTNTSDLNDSREINFEYLKHVVLKFMSSRDAEAYQLIRAVAVLLNFSREEEEMLKQTLEYKMSWFGSKPSPKGTIRPSISGTSTNWS
ncbi:golgin subfamily A member 1-like [Parambassis ranga]|uniref:Golgin subfamily A member 1 n=1 Tax=Parambassis ranga TaxID=210632 RepID=A0A6P7ITW2_9TELE|nr:golgin subfamily A member 1-like [Parambassis ranga]